MPLRLVVAVTAALALLPAATDASSRPAFPATYAGTVNGSISEVSANGDDRHAHWSIKGARLKLSGTRFAHGTWTGYYSVARGAVSYTEDRTIGDCSYAVTDKFALKQSLPPKAVFFLRRPASGRASYDARIQPPKTWDPTQVCTSDDPNAPDPTPPVFASPNLLHTGGRHGKIGRKLQGRFVVSTPGVNGITTWNWTLKPGR